MYVEGSEGTERGGFGDALDQIVADDERRGVALRAQLAAWAGADAEVAGAQDVVGDHAERVVVHRLDMQTQSLIRLGGSALRWAR